MAENFFGCPWGHVVLRSFAFEWEDVFWPLEWEVTPKKGRECETAKDIPKAIVGKKKTDFANRAKV